MESTVLLRGGITPTLPVRIAELPLTFRHNVSSVRLFSGNANENNKNGNQLNAQRCNHNRSEIIRCSRVEKSSFNSQSGGFPSPNAKMALQSLLCFHSVAARERETTDINNEKKRALRYLLDQKPERARSTMKAVYNKYNKFKPRQVASEATLALVEILIHLGTRESLGAAISHMNDLALMPDAPSDAKFHLYKAIIYTLLGDNGSAQTFWEYYTSNIGSDPTGN